MIDYKFICDPCGSYQMVKGTMDNPPQIWWCPVCNEEMRRCYGSHVQTFRIYKTDQYTGEPIEITSKGMRDALLDEHNLTHDTGHYVRRPVYKPAVEEITLDDVREGISRGLHLERDTGAEDFTDCGPPVDIPLVSD